MLFYQPQGRPSSGTSSVGPVLGYPHDLLRLRECVVEEGSLRRSGKGARVGPVRIAAPVCRNLTSFFTKHRVCSKCGLEHSKRLTNIIEYPISCRRLTVYYTSMIRCRPHVITKHHTVYNHISLLSYRTHPRVRHRNQVTPP